MQGQKHFSKISSLVFNSINENDPLNYRLLDEDESGPMVMSVSLLLLSSYFATYYLFGGVTAINDNDEKQILEGVNRSKEDARPLNGLKKEMIGSNVEEWVASFRGAEMRMGKCLTQKEIEENLLFIMKGVWNKKNGHGVG